MILLHRKEENGKIEGKVGFTWRVSDGEELVGSSDGASRHKFV